MVDIRLIEEINGYVPKGKRSEFANEAIEAALKKLNGEKWK